MNKQNKQNKATEQQLKEFKETFELFDINGDNKICKKELKAMMKKLGQEVEENELQKIMKNADIDNDGFINFEEFVKVMTSNTPVDENEVIRQAFQVLDKDKTGKISSKDMREALKKLGDVMSEKDTQEMIAEIDANGDGFIDYEEFLKVLKK